MHIARLHGCSVAFFALNSEYVVHTVFVAIFNKFNLCCKFGLVACEHNIMLFRVWPWYNIKVLSFLCQHVYRHRVDRQICSSSSSASIKYSQVSWWFISIVLGWKCPIAFLFNLFFWPRLRDVGNLILLFWDLSLNMIVYQIDKMRKAMFLVFLGYKIYRKKI